MAKAWVRDLWVKDAFIEVDGKKVRIEPPAAQKRNIKALEDKYKSPRFGKGKRWAVEWFDKTTGEKKKRTKSFAKRGDADAFQAELEDNQRSGRYIDPSLADTLFKDAADKWLDSKLRNKESSMRVYTGDLKTHVLPKWGNVRLAAITEDAVNDWVKQLVDRTAPTNLKRQSRGLNATSIKRIVSIVFGGVIRYAVRRRWIVDNPLENVELPRMEEAVKAILNPSELQELATSAGNCGTDSDRVMIYMMGYCGPRIGETIALRVGDFLKDESRLRITKTVTFDRNGEVYEGPTKGWENRDTPIPAFLVGELEALCVGRDEDEYLFTAAGGQRINAHNWRARVWKKAVEGAGLGDIEGLSPHALRHTCASLAIKGGIDVKTLQMMLGHKKPTITLDTYSHLWPERLGDVANIMEKAHQEVVV